MLVVNDDICRAKLRTTGVAETSFELGDAKFTLIDVGGQRGERRKWVGCFEEVTAVVYLSAINEFDMNMEEDLRKIDSKNPCGYGRLFPEQNGLTWKTVQLCSFYS